MSAKGFDRCLPGRILSRIVTCGLSLEPMNGSDIGRASRATTDLALFQHRAAVQIRLSGIEVAAVEFHEELGGDEVMTRRTYGRNRTLYPIVCGISDIRTRVDGWSEHAACER